MEAGKGNQDIDLEGNLNGDKAPSSSIGRKEDVEQSQTRETGPKLTRRSCAKSRSSFEQDVETGRRPSSDSLEHGVHVVTDGKEETVGHGYASLDNGENHGNKQDDNQKMPAPLVDSQNMRSETPIHAPKSVSFAQ